MTAQFGNNIAAPIFQVDPGSALIQVPWDLSGQNKVTFQLQGQGKVSASQGVGIQDYSPGIFTLNGAGVIEDASGQLVSASHPAAPGSVVIIYCAGLGPLVNQPRTGAPSPFSPLATTIEQPVLSVDGKPVTVLYSGLTPGQVGLYQINTALPADVRTGNTIPIQIAMKGAVSNSATIAIQKAN